MALAAALESLREELQLAWDAGEGSPIRFGVSDVKLTLDVVARREAEGGGKIRWWLVEAGGSVAAAKEQTQTLELTLKPGIYDTQGKLVGPLAVAGDQAKPGD